MDWNEVVPGRMCSGDNNGNIHIWNYKEGGAWTVDKRPFTGHSNSIEDLQWSHDEPTVSVYYCYYYCYCYCFF